MLYEEGKLTVPKPGVYFIYSQIYFTNVSSKSFGYFVCVNNTAVKSMSVQSGRHPFSTVSQSLLLSLNSFDFITVKLIRNDLQAYLREDASFFGAFLI